VGLLFVSTQPIYAQESPAFEKIRDVSPDLKFAARLSCSSETEDSDSIAQASSKSLQRRKCHRRDSPFYEKDHTC
jgi:hypothetical protein